MAHAKLSPSSSKRWITCPGSVALIETLNITDSTSVHAAEGTVAHYIGEQCLLNNKDADSFLGDKFEEDGFKFTVDESMVDAVQVYVDYVREQIEDAEFQGEENPALHVEVKCNLKHLKIEGLDGGTSDTVLIFPTLKLIIIADYKHGQGVAVYPEENTQAMQYAIGALKKLNVDLAEEWDVIITIVQPRLFDGEPIKEWKTTSKQLQQWQEKTLIPAAHATKDPNAPLVPSEEGCRFCPAGGSCKALYEKTQEMALLDFADEKLPDPRLMTPEQKMTVMEHIDMIRAFLVKVEKTVKDEVEQGSKEYEKEYKLVRKTTHRRLNELALDDTFSPLLEVIEFDELHEKKIIALGEIENKLYKKFRADGLSTKEARAQTNSIMSEITDKPEGELVIAPLKDKRPAEKTSAQNDFKHLTN